MDKILSLIKQHLPTLIVVLLALYIYFTWIKPCNCGSTATTETTENQEPVPTETAVGSGLPTIK